MKIGMTELIVILLIAIVIFGSGKIVKLGEDVGKSIKSFRKGLNESEGEDGRKEKGKKK